MYPALFECLFANFPIFLFSSPQRYKPISPSLRVESSYFCQNEARGVMMAEEKVNRVHDDRFNHVGVIHPRYQVCGGGGGGG